MTALEEWELSEAMSSLAALIKYLELLSSEAHFHAFTMETFNLNNYMRIGASAIKGMSLPMERAA